MPLNIPLKQAIVATGRTQARVARSARIAETRLSHIVRGYGPPPSDVERRALARVLDKSEDDLFPVASPEASA